jgi:Acyl-coenzyme A:6-aminopenicillanic acid acyl-transferase
MNMRYSVRRMLVIAVAVVFATCIQASFAVDKAPTEIVAAVRPLLTALAGNARQFEITSTATFPIDGKPQTIEARLVRYDDESFDLAITHPDYAVELRRREDVTAFALPKHNMVYIGDGPVTTADRMTCTGAWQRLASSDSELSMIAFAFTFLAAADVDAFAESTIKQAGFQFNDKTGRWETKEASFATQRPGQLTTRSHDVTVSITARLEAPESPSATDWPNYKTVKLPRDELESTVIRGVRRAGEVLRPNDNLLRPDQEDRSVANGRLRWVDGQRVATLWGTPEEIGTAHGQLLKDEARRCIESVMYSFGTAHAIQTGRWFRHDLDNAYAHLESHIPERHKRETQAMAVALDIEPRVAQMLNVFPELFHCSGFAVFGSATTDGKLYHGRVLDYMTTIGLQDSATTFIVKPDGYIPFANVGYGGFVGSVSGMNAEGISLGEMGGHGEGNWDGVPMATLMRRALEECDSLAEVKSLWQNSPRTCEYYFVFADGKTNEAVGVAATPETIEFINPGAGHELLGDGIKDAVVLSAGSRLEELRRRVKQKHGQIDAEIGMWLMSRPVAMQSNLHNVLFVPQDGIFYVANASHNKPAAEMPYVRLDLQALLNTTDRNSRPVAASE